jgi:hypothetical protein
MVQATVLTASLSCSPKDRDQRERIATFTMEIGRCCTSTRIVPGNGMSHRQNAIGSVTAAVVGW